MLAVTEVVLSIRQRQTTLQQIRIVVLRVVESWRNPKSEQVLSVEVGVVQGIHVSAKRLAERIRQLLLIANIRYLLQQRLQRRDALGLYGGFVHIRVVEIGNLAGVRSRRAVRLRRFLNQCGRAFARQVAQSGEDADATAVGWDLTSVQPLTVRVTEEIVAGLN